MIVRIFQLYGSPVERRFARPLGGQHSRRGYDELQTQKLHATEKLHVVERFSRTGPEALKYEITIDDTETWTKPWSLMIPLKQSTTPIFEYACHEGNIGL
jgi:hypothetical protein